MKSLLPLLTSVLAYEADIISDIPGLKKTPVFNSYSGYLNASSDHKLHYFFTESQRPKDDTPLLVWFNGGPGCSSLLGLFTELGPFYLDKNLPNEVFMKDFAWNNIAHTLFIESPIGVGFSYSESEQRPYHVGDSSTARDAELAILNFFEKFPQHAERDFYLSGESYGGIYVPTLGSRLANTENLSVRNRFKGVAIGNGLYNWADNENSMVFFATYHGLIDLEEYSEAAGKCCENSIFDMDNCHFHDSEVQECSDFLAKVAEITWSSGILPYNMYQPCQQPSELNRFFDVITKKVLKRSSRLYKFGGPPCEDDGFLIKYFNRKDVKAAFHVKADIKWETCASNLDYDMQVKDTVPYFNDILDPDYDRKVLIYSGDVDMACNFLGTEHFLESRLVPAIGYQTAKEYREWMSTSDKNGRQVAGFAKDWKSENSKNTLHFRTIRGAGHMVPEDKPREAFKMIATFLKGADSFKNSRTILPLLQRDDYVKVQVSDNL